MCGGDLGRLDTAVELGCGRVGRQQGGLTTWQQDGHGESGTAQEVAADIAAWALDAVAERSCAAVP